MKSVQCPICGTKQHSDSFPSGERFPCVSCHRDVIVSYVNESPILTPAEDILDKMAWAHGLWENGKLSVSPEKLQGLGEFLIRAMELDLWPRLSIERISEKLAEISSLRRLLAEKGSKDQFYAFYQSLLEIHLSLRKEKAI